MKRILVVCGAGASSTFLVHWMRRAATERDLPVSVSAASTEQLATSLGAADVLLVGSHLEPRFAELAQSAGERGIRAVLLPRLAFDASGAATALRLALKESELETESKEAETTRG